MRNSMSFSNDASLRDPLNESEKKPSKGTSTKNAQYYKERMEAHITDLATSDSVEIRFAVASSANASASCLKQMLENETDESVIGTILTHPNLSKTVKVGYAKKNADLVKRMIGEDISADEVSEAVNR